VLGCVLTRRPTSATTTQQRDGPGPALALGAILAGAAALRFHALDTGLWHDEILILYTVLARLSLGLFGDGCWVLRLPAAVFGIASVGALYGLAREVTDRGEALLTAALLAFSYHHVWFSQNARGYTGLLLWNCCRAGSCCGRFARGGTDGGSCTRRRRPSASTLT
jgi:Dolichyl-phosphate-mannose-protein mannosyltransferase